MRIEKNSEICGLPALDARKFMRYIQDSTVTIRNCMEYLHLTEITARKLVKCLEREGYLKPNLSGRKKTWTITVNGNSLARASAAKPIKRKTAAKKLEELLLRVHEVNSSEAFLFKVTKVIVFGSYITGKEYINDIDVAVELARKEEDLNRYREIERNRFNALIESGRRFRTTFDMATWPHLDVYKYLKGRSRSLSITTTDDGILEDAPYEVYFEEDS